MKVMMMPEDEIKSTIYLQGAAIIGDKLLIFPHSHFRLTLLSGSSQERRGRLENNIRHFTSLKYLI